MDNRRVLIAGGSGLIGKRIYQLLKYNGYDPYILSRNKKLSERADFKYWNPDEKQIDVADGYEVHAIINLSGEGIADKKWSDKRKKELIQSRTVPAEFIAELLNSGKLKTRTYIGASAIGYYGNRPGELCTEEDAAQNTSFLSQCCVAWEAAHNKVGDHVRKVIIRIGIVMAKEGGALDQYRPLIAFRMAPYFGGGKPIMSWVTLDDLARLFLFAVENENVKGVYNGVGDNPVNSKDFAKAFIRSQKKWAAARSIPTFAVKMMMGEMSAVVLESQTVSNEKARKAGFEFNSKDIDGAFRSVEG